MLKSWIKAGLSVASAPLILVGLYLLAATVGGLVTVNRNQVIASSGIDIYLLNNGIHTDLVVPIVTPERNWRDILPIQALEIIPGFHDYLAFGWGDREFYLSTPTWATLRVTSAAKALFGFDSAVMHVEAMPHPLPGANTRHLRLSADAYRRLTDYLQAGFLRSDQGLPLLIPDVRYTLHDAFFVAEGHYTMFTTCNEWVRKALAQAGVRVPLWAPFGQALFYQLPEGQ